MCLFYAFMNRLVLLLLLSRNYTCPVVGLVAAETTVVTAIAATSAAT